MLRTYWDDGKWIKYSSETIGKEAHQKCDGDGEFYCTCSDQDGTNENYKPPKNLTKLKVVTGFILWPLFGFVLLIVAFVTGFYEGPKECEQRDKWIWQIFWKNLTK